MDLLIEKDSLWSFPDGSFRFCSERPDKTLLFQKEGTAKDKFISRETLVHLHGIGEAYEIDFFKTRKNGRETPQEANDNAVFGPDEENSPEAIRAKSFQFYVKQWDIDNRVSLGRAGLRTFIAKLQPAAIAKGLVHNVQPARLYEAIRHCGVKGHRPLRLFRSRRGKGTRKRLHPFVLDALDQAVKAYWTDRTWDYGDAYAHFRGLVRVENERRNQNSEPPLKFPKRMETLRRRINAATSHATWSLKYSKFEADRKFKGTREGLKADRPLELVIMDHTTVDDWTVLDTATYIPFQQRAHLTMAIDVATRMPLGHLISFEPPSLYSVLTTLKRVNKNKNYISKIFGHLDGTWDGWGHPETILVDNGLEFTSPSFQDALADIGTEIIWAPVRTPEYKAIGERFFHTMNTMLFHKLKGGVPYDPKTMRAVGLRPDQECVISLGELDELIHRAIIEYQKNTHDTLNAIPARIWEQKIRRHGRRFIPDIRQLNAMLGRVGTATLTRAGIKFDNMVFHHPHVTTNLLADILPVQLKTAKRSQSSKPISSARVKVKFKWNPSDASAIEVWNEGATPKEYISLPNRDARFSQHLSFWQAARVREFAKKEDLKFVTDEQKWQARQDLRKVYDKFASSNMRDSRDARRATAQIMGTYDDVIDDLQSAELKFKDVTEAAAAPSPDGLEAATLVPSEVPATERVDDTSPPIGFRPTKAAQRKRAATIEHGKKQAEEEARRNRKKTSPASKTTKIDMGEKGSGTYSERLRGKLDWKKK